MKSPALRFALVFVVLTAAFKAAAFAWLPLERGPAASVMVYLLGEVMAITLAFKAAQKPGQPPIFLENIKDAVRPALLYAIFVALFAFVYHEYINPEYMEERITYQLTQAEEAWENELQFVPEYKKLGHKRWYENQEKMAQTMNKPFLHATFSLVGFFMFGVAFSLLLVAAFRRIPIFRKGLGG